MARRSSPRAAILPYRMCVRRETDNPVRSASGLPLGEHEWALFTGAAAHARTVHSEGTHEAASHLTSHARHGNNQAGERPRQTPSQSLTVA